MKRDTSISYIGLKIELHGCVDDPELLCRDMKNWLMGKLDPVDYESDVDIEIVESAGWKKKYKDKENE